MMLQRTTMQGEVDKVASGTEFHQVSWYSRVLIRLDDGGGLVTLDLRNLKDDPGYQPRQRVTVSLSADIRGDSVAGEGR